ncbi:MAG: SCP2 sterol-binding domain-containing protein [Myxococcales bacterium]|nr:SCP2 sterol-binding domain-containing protein [Myxococcales bacterium]
MAHQFPSEDWTTAYKDAVNANEIYRTAGKDWTFGPVAMVVSKDESKGLPDDVGMILDVRDGTCHGTTYVQGIDKVQDAPFIIVAPYERWKKVIRGEMDPIKGMMQGQLKLTKGHLPTMLRFVESSRQLVVSATQVPTEFIDE